ncbi:hypothetical protein E2C01_013111 [Portunus trituberculatus]|uniref:Uncharacterized protein n=1 Tax=Portunus trituberculatus TaxID=210409 RepID=A0A5B7DFS7_PORTR|nr:hypothetical protein [Portunus trituberculatus]
MKLADTASPSSLMRLFIALLERGDGFLHVGPLSESRTCPTLTCWNTRTPTSRSPEGRGRCFVECNGGAKRKTGQARGRIAVSAIIQGVAEAVVVLDRGAQGTLDGSVWQRMGP